MRRSLAILYIVLTLLPWAFILLASGRGFDFTDESFYLLSYSHPEDISTTFSLFGVVGKPLYDLVGGDLAWMRLLGSIIWLIVVIVTSWITLVFIRRRLHANGIAIVAQPTWRLLLVPIASGTLYYANWWLLTPSYNWLTLVGLALFWVGFLLWLEPNRPKWLTYNGAALLAFAAAIVFWSKATSAVLLPLFPLVALIRNTTQLRRLFAPQTVMWGVGGLVLGLSLPLWYGFSAEAIVAVINHGIEHQQLLKPGEYTGIVATLVDSLGKIGDFLSLHPYPLMFLLIWCIFLLTAVLVWQRSKRRTVLIDRIRIWFVLGWLVNLILVTVLFKENVGYWAFCTVLALVVFSATGYFALGMRIPDQNDLLRPRLSVWALPVFSLVLISVVGTTNDYASQSGMAAYFFLLGAVVSLIIFDNNPTNAVLTQIAIPTLLLAVAFLTFTGSLTPYRQKEAVWAMRNRVNVNGGGTELIVGAETFRYVTELRALASASNFQAETPLIDLTGHSPGAIYVLGGRAYGFPWLLGGYRGSNPAAAYILNQWEQEQLDNAWVLTAVANGERPLSPSVLTQVGLDFPEGYELIGTIRWANSQEVQGLWQPVTNANTQLD